MVEITALEHDKGKRMKRSEDSIRDFWDNIKCTNICIKGIPHKEKAKRKDQRKYLK